MISNKVIINLNKFCTTRKIKIGPWSSWRGEKEAKLISSNKGQHLLDWATPYVHRAKMNTIISDRSMIIWIDYSINIFVLDEQIKLNNRLKLIRWIFVQKWRESILLKVKLISRSVCEFKWVTSLFSQVIFSSSSFTYVSLSSLSKSQNQQKFTNCWCVRSTSFTNPSKPTTTNQLKQSSPFFTPVLDTKQPQLMFTPIWSEKNWES